MAQPAIQVSSSTIQGQVRKLRVTWSIETAQDLGVHINWYDNVPVYGPRTFDGDKDIISHFSVECLARLTDKVLRTDLQVPDGTLVFIGTVCIPADSTGTGRTFVMATDGDTWWAVENKLEQEIVEEIAKEIAKEIAEAVGTPDYIYEPKNNPDLKWKFSQGDRQTIISVIERWMGEQTKG